MTREEYQSLLDYTRDVVTCLELLEGILDLQSPGEPPPLELLPHLTLGNAFALAPTIRQVLALTVAVLEIAKKLDLIETAVNDTEGSDE